MTVMTPPADVLARRFKAYRPASLFGSPQLSIWPLMGTLLKIRTLSLSIEALRRRLYHMNLDARRLSSLLRGQSCRKPSEPPCSRLIAADLDVLQTRLSVPSKACLSHLSDNLPVSQKQGEIMKPLKSISGDHRQRNRFRAKPPQIPKICLALGRGVKGASSGHTQPRRQRPYRCVCAEEMESELGRYVELQGALYRSGW